MEKSKIDYTIYNREDLINRLNLLESIINTIESNCEMLRSSNKTLLRIINTGTITVNGEPISLNEENGVLNKGALDIKILEQIAFDPKTPAKEAKKALTQLLKIKKKKK